MLDTIKDWKTEINNKYERALEAAPTARIRNLAADAGVTEAELVHAGVGQITSTRLSDDYKALLARVPQLGRVMGITRNDSIVHETKGTYAKPWLDHPGMGLFAGEEIDIRFFWDNWKYNFLVEEETKRGKRQSLQFFACDGTAIHKIYMLEETDTEALDALVAEMRHPDGDAPLLLTPAKVDSYDYQPIETGQEEAFAQEWLGLQDTHDFYGLIKKYNLNRVDALKYAPEGYVTKVDNDSTRKAITAARDGEVAIMVFVGNPAAIQIYSGTVKKLLDHNEWFNVMDPNFNLHIKEGDIKESYIVQKPTKDGIVTALETYDEDKQLIGQYFGKRKPGIPEAKNWRELVSTTFGVTIQE